MMLLILAGVAVIGLGIILAQAVAIAFLWRRRRRAQSRSQNQSALFSAPQSETKTPPPPTKPLPSTDQVWHALSRNADSAQPNAGEGLVQIVTVSAQAQSCHTRLPSAQLPEHSVDFDISPDSTADVGLRILTPPLQSTFADAAALIGQSAGNRSCSKSLSREHWQPGKRTHSKRPLHRVSVHAASAAYDCEERGGSSSWNDSHAAHASAQGINNAIGSRHISQGSVQAVLGVQAGRSVSNACCTWAKHPATTGNKDQSQSCSQQAPVSPHTSMPLLRPDDSSGTGTGTTSSGSCCSAGLHCLPTDMRTAAKTKWLPKDETMTTPSTVGTNTIHKREGVAAALEFALDTMIAQRPAGVLMGRCNHSYTLTSA